MSVTIEDIEALKRILTELPRHQPKQVSKQEAIARHVGQAAQVRDRYDALADEQRRLVLLFLDSL